MGLSAEDNDKFQIHEGDEDGEREGLENTTGQISRKVYIVSERMDDEVPATSEKRAKAADYF